MADKGADGESAEIEARRLFHRISDLKRSENHHASRASKQASKSYGSGAYNSDSDAASDSAYFTPDESDSQSATFSNSKKALENCTSASVAASVSDPPSTSANSSSVSIVDSSTDSQRLPVQPDFPWLDILSSAIPIDAYAIGDSGVVLCIRCNVSFSTFQIFREHYEESREHRGRPFARKKTRLRPYVDSNDLPPPLVRSASPPPTNVTDSLQSRSLPADHRTEVIDQDFVARDGPPNSCLKCMVMFSDATALQRHKASHTHKHPYYCVHCTIEYNDFEALQMVCLV